MMYEADIPFSALRERDVSIARVIKNKKTPKKPKIITLTLPLKVLFVIGRKLDNALRPGAEYLGLLRQMKIRFKNSDRNRHLNIKVLTEATLDELKESVEEFQPSVVHFISHGDEKGRLLLSKRDEQTNAYFGRTRLLRCCQIIVRNASDQTTAQCPADRRIERLSYFGCRY